MIPRLSRARTDAPARADMGECGPDRVRLVGAPEPIGDYGATLLLDLTDARVRPRDVMRAEETWLRHLGAEMIVWEPVNARTIRLHAYLTHPLDRPVPWSELAPVQGAKDRAPMGVTAIPGRQAIWHWRVSHLITGTSGSGKTMALRSMLHGLVVQRVPVRLWIADNKGDFVAWSTEPGLGGYARDHGSCVDLLDRFAARVDHRYALRAKWTGEDYAHVPTPWDPLELLIAGELLKVLDDGSKEQQSRAQRAVATITSTGREAAASMIATAQTATKQQSDRLALVRDLFPARIVLRVPNASMVAPALGVGAEFAPAHRIPEVLEGVGYYLDPTTGHPVMYRSAYTSWRDQALLSAQLGIAHVAMPDAEADADSDEPPLLRAVNTNRPPARTNRRNRA